MHAKNNNHYLFVIYDKYTKKFLTYLINAKKKKAKVSITHYTKA